MARRLLPALRTTTHPAARTAQRKIVAADYYAALTAAGVYGGGYRARPWPVERAVSEALERTVYVFKSVGAISGHGAALPFRLKQGEDVLDDHPLYRLLNKRANPMETGTQFRKRLGAQVLLSKRGAFVEVTTARNGDPIRFDLLPPGRTRPVPQNPDDPEGLARNLIKHFEVESQYGPPRRIDPEKVRWIRDPHPLDPFSGMTPLEAAGMSVELDVFSRWWNVQFLRNDARPAGILAVDGELSEEDQAYIDENLEAGPPSAGKFVTIAGKVSWVDLSARPRDMQYAVMARSAKEEILTAFGVPESVIGNASGRTWDNAEQELYNFWTITMPPFLALLTTGLDEDSEDDLEGYFDTSGVEVLQRVEKARREEARTEVEVGLRSIDEYREMAGLPPLDTPQTRALWIPAGKQPLPANEDDAAALGLGAVEEQEAPAEEGQEPLPVEGGAQPVGPADGAPAVEPPGTAPAGPPVAAQQEDLFGFKHLRVVPTLEAKQEDPQDLPAGGAEPPPGVESEPDPAVTAHLEAVLAAALTATASRLLMRSAARLTSAKTRRGTRHWRPDAAVASDTRAGQQALDAAYIIDVQRWQDDAVAAASPVVASAAAVAAAGLYAAVAMSPSPDVSTRVLGRAVGDVLALIGTAAAAMAARLVDVVAEADQGGADIEQIRVTLAGQATVLASVAASVAVQAAAATILGALDAAAADIAADGIWEIDRTWISRRDGRVRPTHVKADGQTQPLGVPFAVGTALLRYPGDPLGPPGEVRNCRCSLRYQATATGRSAPVPAGALRAG